MNRLIRAWLTTAVVDGLFSSALAALVYGSTVARLWQGVASTLLGPDAMNGGTRTVLIGLLMHLGVALAWSLLFWLVGQRSAGLRRATASATGVVKTAAWYGPLVWLVMSLIVIPLVARRSPSITIRWLVQLIGHVPFVGIPIVYSIAAPGRPGNPSVGTASD
jgi:hypothetical protein